MREELVLRLARPLVESDRMPIVLALHFLQEDQGDLIGSKIVEWIAAL